MPATSATTPATITTTETFPGTVKEERMEKERELRLMAGAIRCSFKKQSGKWIMKTEWNVIGGNR